MESSFASRVKQFRAEKQLSQTAFAERCGLTQGNIAHMEGGKEPLQSNVAKLMSGFPDLNPDWLLLGTGSMLRDGRALTPAPAPDTDPQGPPPTRPAGTLHIVRLTYEELVAENADLHRRLADSTGKVVEMLTEEVKRLRKPKASADAAGLYDDVDAIAQALPAAFAFQVAGFQQAGVVRQLSA